MKTRFLIIIAIVIAVGLVAILLLPIEQHITCEQMGGIWNTDHCMITQEKFDSNNLTCDPGPVLENRTCSTSGISMIIESKSGEGFEDIFGGPGNRHPAFLGFDIPQICTEDMIKHLVRYSTMFDRSAPYYSLEWIGMDNSINDDDFDRCVEELLERNPKKVEDEKTLDVTGHTWDCASVSVEKLSSYDLEELQTIPNKDSLKFLKFTDDNLEDSKILKTLVDIVDSRDYPLNERGYAELKVEEIIKIQHILLEKVISEYGGTEMDYSQEADPIRYYDDNPNQWEQDKHRWKGYLTGFYSPTIISQENLYHINGLGSSIRSHNLEETINIQLLDMTKEEYLEHDSKRKFIEIAEDEMSMMPGVKDAILQIGTWETSVKENQYTGDKVQRETMDYFREQTQKQFPEFENDYIVDFTYDGNHYRTTYLVC